MEKENLSEKAIRTIAEQVRQNVEKFTALMDHAGTEHRQD
jgi:hypothetical protein